MRTLVLGGIRSGKSQWAEVAIAESAGPGRSVRYLATGSPAGDDADWSARLAAHRARRPAHWSARLRCTESAQITTHLVLHKTNLDAIALPGWQTGGSHPGKLS